jgi:hypothetical protein
MFYTGQKVFTIGGWQGEGKNHKYHVGKVDRVDLSLSAPMFISVFIDFEAETGDTTPVAMWYDVKSLIPCIDSCDNCQVRFICFSKAKL